jgi:tetratricopeptide (TPR) repeat protein
MDPNYGDARINRALVLRARGETQGARAELERAAADPRAAPLAWRQLGALALAEGRVEEAVQAWERSLALDPAQPGLSDELERARKGGSEPPRALPPKG